MRTAVNVDVSTSSELYRLEYHGWREKPGQLAVPGPVIRFSTVRRSLGSVARTRRDASLLALARTASTPDKHVRGTVDFLN